LETILFWADLLWSDFPIRQNRGGNAGLLAPNHQSFFRAYKMTHDVSSARTPQRKADAFHSFLGVGATVAGVAVAIISMPEDPRPAGAMFWPALCLAAGLLTVPILRARRSVETTLRSEHILMVALVYWLLLDPLQSAYPLDGVAYDSVATAIVAIGVMAVGVWIGVIGKGQRPPKLIVQATQTALDDSKLFLAATICFALGMFHFVLSSRFDYSVLIGGLSRSRFDAPWSRGTIGDWRSFSEQLTYFGYILPSLCVLLAYRKGWMQPKVIISLCYSLIVVAFLAQTGGRRIIGVVIGAALVSWLLLNRRFRSSVLIGAASVIVLLLVTMQEILIFRGMGLAATIPQSFDYIHVDDNFLRLVQTSELFPEIHPFVGLEPIIYLITRPIPRVFWPDKPVSFGYDLTDLVGLRGLSLSHSIVGELYAMGGLLTVFLGGLVFGRLASVWNNILKVPGDIGKSMVYSLGVMILFASFRSLNELVIMSYGLLSWLAVAWTIGRRRGVSKTVSSLQSGAEFK
jgi:oligosaccharide repeat unit polymerase